MVAWPKTFSASLELFVSSHPENCCFLQWLHDPHAMQHETTTRWPTLNLDTDPPTDSMMPMHSWPITKARIHSWNLAGVHLTVRTAADSARRDFDDGIPLVRDEGLTDVRHLHAALPLPRDGTHHLRLGAQWARLGVGNVPVADDVVHDLRDAFIAMAVDRVEGLR
jgi:hypothetical protein